jgi:aminopeptidase-like protein
VLDFSPYGYDERQFCSPGINLPVGRLTRTPNACFPEYHTSADDLEFVSPESLENSLGLCARIAYTLENDARCVNLNPMGEPQLGKRGLFQKTSADRDVGRRDLALLWILNLSDGHHTLLDIAERSGLAFDVIHSAANDLMACGLLRPVDGRVYHDRGQ